MRMLWPCQFEMTLENLLFTVFALQSHNAVLLCFCCQQPELANFEWLDWFTVEMKDATCVHTQLEDPLENYALSDAELEDWVRF